MVLNGTTSRAVFDQEDEPDVGPASDASLVRQVVAGSQDALARLYDRHGEAVYAAAHRTSRDGWIAAEVVQETFLAVWNRAELFDPARGTLRSWLLTIARNRAVDHLRGLQVAVVTSRPPNCGQTLPGSATGCAIAPSSITPYVANASVVAGVHTGSSRSAASLALPAEATT